MSRPPEPPSLAQVLGATLRQDRVAQWVVGLYVASSLVYFLGFDDDTSAVFRALLVLAFQVRLSELHHREERRFWNDLSLAYVSWLVGDGSSRLFDIFFPEGVKGLDPTLVHLAFSAVVYVFLVLAVERRPHRPTPGPGVGLERLLALPTIPLFILGLLVYVAFLSYHPQGPQQALFFYFLPLDVYLAVKFLNRARSVAAPRWRTIYLLLAVTPLIMVVADVDGILGRLLESWPERRLAAPLWNLTFVVPALAARLRHRPYPPAPVGVERHELDEKRFLLTALTLSLGLAFPLLHFAFEGLALFGPESLLQRAAMSQLWLLTMGGLAVVQYLILERQAQARWIEHVQQVEQLQKSEKDLRLMVERQRGEEEKSTAETLFHRAFHGYPDLLLIRGLSDGRLIEVNHACERLLGYRREDLVGRTAHEIGLWRSRDALKLERRLLSREEVRDLPVAWRLRSGETRRLLCSAARVHLGGAEHVLLIGRLPGDGEPRQAELRELAEALERSEDAFCVLDGDGRIVQWSESAEGLWGFVADEAVGRLAAEALFAASVDELAAARRAVEEDGLWQGRLAVRGRDGRAVDASLWWIASRGPGVRQGMSLVFVAR